LEKNTKNVSYLYVKPKFKVTRINSGARKNSVSSIVIIITFFYTYHVELKVK